jgi:hypothetical protein
MLRLLCVLWTIIFLVGAAREYFKFGTGKVYQKHSKVVRLGGKGGSQPTTRYFVLFVDGRQGVQLGEEMQIPGRIWESVKVEDKLEKPEFSLTYRINGCALSVLPDIIGHATMITLVAATIMSAILALTSIGERVCDAASNEGQK